MNFEYELPNQEKLVLQSEAVEYFSRRKQRKFQFERGGILFAQFEEGRTVISLAAGPYKNDVKLPFQYRANKESAQKDIEKKFKDGFHYVGEWHTHPQKTPIPSSQDMDAIKCCYNKSEHKLDYFVLIIVGQSSFPKGLWVGVADESSVYPLQIYGTA